MISLFAQARVDMRRHLDEIISPPFIAPYPSNELSKILMVAELARSFCLYHTTFPRQQGGHAQNECGKTAEMTVTSKEPVYHRINSGYVGFHFMLYARFSSTPVRHQQQLSPERQVHAAPGTVFISLGKRRRRQSIPGAPKLQRTGGHGLRFAIPDVTGTVTYCATQITMVRSSWGRPGQPRKQTIGGKANDNRLLPHPRGRRRP